MRTLLIAMTALAALGVAGCWVPVQISAPSDNTVYVLDHRMGVSPEGRVMRCSGTVCQKIYHPR